MPKSLSILLLVLLTLVSCKDDEAGTTPPPPPDPVVAGKTLVLFMPWTAGADKPYSGNLYAYFESNIRSIETAIGRQGGLGGNRLLVFISKTPTYSALVEIKYDGQKAVRDTLLRYTGNTYASAEGIGQVLTDVRQRAEAAGYAMLIGCHGSGWIPKGVDNYYRTRVFGGNTADYQMEVSELAEGISLAGMHMQYVAFDDCYMAGVEVAYDLREAADYLVASTSEIMADGLPYEDIWPQLISNTPDYRSMVDSFYQYYKAYPYPYGALSVIDCRQVTAVAALMREANQKYTLDAGRTGELQKMDGFGQTTFFDMRSYTDALCAGGAEGAEIARAIARLVPHTRCTPQIYTSLTPHNGNIQTVDVTTYSGITISDPTTNSYVTPYLHNTAWWQATH